MTLQERVNIVVNMCNQEIERHKVFMHCAEHNDNYHEWLRHYDLRGIYMTVRDILTGKIKLEEPDEPKEDEC